MPSIRRPSRPAPAWPIRALLALAALTAACDENFADPDQIDETTSQVVAVSGNNQSGALGALLPQALRVQVLDERGNPAPRQRVDFRAMIGEGLLSATSGVTDFAGFTQVGFVPTTTGELLVQASQPGGGSVSFFLAAIDSSQVRNPASLVPIGGTPQTGQVGTILPQPLTVLATNADGNPIERLPVVFTATTDGTLLLTAREGDFTEIDSLGNTPIGTDSLGRQVVSFTNENGVAAVLVRLAIRPGANDVRASATAFGGGNAEAVFTVTGRLGDTTSADSLIKISGDDQNVTFDTTGTGFTPAHTFNPMVLQVTDRFGNPISGLTVFFRVSNGFGTVTPTQAVTDENGFAQTVYTSEAGNLGGFAVSASVPGVGAVQFVGSITAVGGTPDEEPPPPPPPAPADSLHKVTADPVISDTTTTQSFPLVVQAFRGSTPQGGVAVEFIASGEGSLSSTNVTTGSDGLARTTYTTAVGEQSFTVSAVSAFGTVQFTGSTPGAGG